MKMENNELSGRRRELISFTSLASDYCATLQHVSELEKAEFIDMMSLQLPKIYVAMLEMPAPEKHDAEGEKGEESEEWEAPEDIDEYSMVSLEEPDSHYFETRVDEDFYESIRRHIEALLGPDDTFLETFEEDMKYSDSPIAASVSESLADIFQPLYDFTSIVRETDGSLMDAAFEDCRDNFNSYWSQTLCNVLRAINHLRLNSEE